VARAFGARAIGARVAGARDRRVRVCHGRCDRPIDPTRSIRGTPETGLGRGEED
jgi:hypothetical protein